MAIGRYLSTDTGDAIRKFGSSVGEIAGGFADYEDLRSRARDRERARALQERRERRYRDEEDRLRAAQTFTMREALLDEEPERRTALAAGLPDQTRFDLGYRREIPGLDVVLQPPTAAGPSATPTPIKRPTRPAVDPFEGVPGEPDRFRYMGVDYESEEDMLGAVRRYNQAQQEGSEDDRDFRPTTTDIMRVSDDLLTRYDITTGERVPLVPPEERAALIARAREDELPLTEVVAEARALLERYPNYATPGDTANMLGPAEQEDEGPGLFRRIWDGVFGDDEEEPPQPTVRMPWPRPEDFRNRAPEGMRGPPVDEGRPPVGSLRGPEDDSPIDPNAGGMLSAEERDMVRAALEQGMSESDVARLIANDLGVDEETALSMVRSAR